MFTSDTELTAEQRLRHAAVSIGCALLLAFAGAVYEHFSFGIYSNFMIYAFAAPLISGALQLFAVLRGKTPQAGTLFLLHAASAAAAAGCITAGIIRISGRTNGLLIVYPVLTAVLLILTAVSYRKDCAQSA